MDIHERTFKLEMFAHWYFPNIKDDHSRNFGQCDSLGRPHTYKNLIYMSPLL